MRFIHLLHYRQPIKTAYNNFRPIIHSYRSEIITLPKGHKVNHVDNYQVLTTLVFLNYYSESVTEKGDNSMLLIPKSNIHRTSLLLIQKSKIHRTNLFPSGASAGPNHWGEPTARLRLAPVSRPTQ